MAIVYPDVTLLAVGIIFGFYLLLAGVFELVEAIVGDPASRALSAIVGVVALIAGLICLRRPGDSLLALVVVLGAYLIVTGVARLVRAFGQRRASRLGAAEPRSSTSSWASSSSPGPTRASSPWPCSSASR